MCCRQRLVSYKCIFSVKLRCLTIADFTDINTDKFRTNTYNYAQSPALLPSHIAQMVLELFLDNFLLGFSLNPLLGIHLFLCFFGFYSFHAFHRQCNHANKFRAPIVELSTAHTVLSAQVVNSHAIFVLFKDRLDLALTIS